MERLSALDQHADIIVANDAEGNSFSDPVDVDYCYYVEGESRGRYESVSIREDLLNDGYDDEFIDNHYRPAAVLWPV